MHIFPSKITKTFADESMIRYNSTRQISIEEFKTPFLLGIDPKNRWVRLSQVVPWDELAQVYCRALKDNFGRPAISPRVVIGALIVKHEKCLSDEETVEEIRENPYLQYFLGLEEFTHNIPFDASLFVTIRKRLGEAAFEEINQSFLQRVEAIKKEQKKTTNKKSTKKKSTDQEPPKEKSEQTSNKGQLILDATVAPADIKYPTDIDLLNSAREQSERLIDELYQPTLGKIKPRTYRRKAHREYLQIAKKKKKSEKQIRKSIRKQLGYVHRNINTINVLLDQFTGKDFPLSFMDQKTFWVIQELYRQQSLMYKSRSHQLEDRIVSVSQPHVRPIVRGKAGRDVEFGAKISASIVDGIFFLDHLSWDNYNESQYLKQAVEKFKKRFGCYPAQVLGDKIYGNRKNRDYLTENNIEFLGQKLGRRPKLTAEIRKRFKEAAKRNQIEGGFGLGKRRFGMDRIKARRTDTSMSWICTILFVMNLVHWLRDHFFVPNRKWLWGMLLEAHLYFKERIERIFRNVLIKNAFA